jgi:beta-glucosidase
VCEPRVPVPANLACPGSGGAAIHAADLAAARELTFRVDARPDARSVWYAAWWTDPVYLGSYPADALAGYGRAAPRIAAGDMAVIHAPLDFLAINLYKGIWARAGASGPEDVELPAGYPASSYGWPVTPECAYWGPRWFHERYRRPIVITENGFASRDWVSLDGRVHDGPRIDFLHRYLRELGRALHDGVPITGYFHWSALDNFEWDEGYQQRFGLIHVDYATQRRTPKDSAYFYRSVIDSHGRCLWGEREVPPPHAAGPALPRDGDVRP